MTAPDDKPAFAAAMVALAVALREKEPDVVLLRTYFDALQDLEIEFVVAAAERLRAHALWFPKPSEWRAMAASVATERAEVQRAFLRQLPAPLCKTCTDTGWTDAAARSRMTRRPIASTRAISSSVRNGFVT